MIRALGLPSRGISLQGIARFDQSQMDNEAPPRDGGSHTSSRLAETHFLLSLFRHQSSCVVWPSNRDRGEPRDSPPPTPLPLVGIFDMHTDHVPRRFG